jgi:hypothetical protein
MSTASRTLIARGSSKRSAAIRIGAIPMAPPTTERLGLRDMTQFPALAPYSPDVDILDELAEQGRVAPPPLAGATRGAPEARRPGSPQSGSLVALRLWLREPGGRIGGGSDGGAGGGAALGGSGGGGTGERRLSPRPAACRDHQKSQPTVPVEPTRAEVEIHDRTASGCSCWPGIAPAPASTHRRGGSRYRADRHRAWRPADPTRQLIRRRGGADPPRSGLSAFNKPLGVASTMSDDLGRPCVRLCGGPLGTALPRGALDSDTEGLLLLTNDGELAPAGAPVIRGPQTYVAQILGPVPATGQAVAGRGGPRCPVNVDSFRPSTLPRRREDPARGTQPVVRRLLEPSVIR